MITVRLDHQKLKSQAGRLHRMFAKRKEDIKQKIEPKMRMVAGDASFALLSATMPSEASGIGKAIANIKHDFKNGLLTEGEAFEVIERESSRRNAIRFYSLFKRGDMAGARAVLAASGTSISGYQVGDPEAIDTGFIATFKSRVISKTDLDEIMKKKVVPRLGFTASGWAACMERLGYGGDVIRWKGTTLHGSDGGAVHTVHEKDRVTIFIANLRPLARKLINPSTVNAIMESRREWLARLMQESV